MFSSRSQRISTGGAAQLLRCGCGRGVVVGVVFGCCTFLALVVLRRFVDGESRGCGKSRTASAAVQNKLRTGAHTDGYAPLVHSGFVSDFLPLPLVVAGAFGRGRCCWLRGVVLGALRLLLLLFRGLDSCARAQNLGLGGSWLRWLFGVRGMWTAATSRCLGLGRVHLVYAASHRSPLSRLSSEASPRMWSTA